MGDYFNYYPLRLKGFEKFFFRAIVFSFRVVLIAIGFALLFSRVIGFNILGFWLVIIFMACFMRTKFWSMLDIRLGKNKNLANYFNQEALDLVFDTFKDLENTNIGPPTTVLLLKLSSSPGVKQMLKKLNIDSKKFQNEVASYIESRNESPEIDLKKSVDYFIKENFAPVFVKSREIAKSLSFPCISSEIIFTAMASFNNFEIQNILGKFRITPEFAMSVLTSVIFKERQKFSSTIQSLAKFIEPCYATNLTRRKISIQSTPFLDKYGLNLTLLSKLGKIGFLIGHRREIGEITSIFNKNSSPNIILYGEQSVGKKSVVAHLSWLIANGLGIGKFSNYKIIQIDISNVISEAEQEFKIILARILNEALSSGDVILYFPDAQNILFVTADSIISTISQFISEGLSVIMSTNQISFLKLNQFDEIQRNFKGVEVEEISVIETISLLTLEAKSLEQKYKILITPQAIGCIASLSKKYLSDKIIPNSALDIMNEIVEFIKNQQNIKIITEEIAGDYISKNTAKLKDVSFGAEN